MKKRITATAAAVLALSLTMGSVSFAAGTPSARATKSTFRCVYTDINGDGICDNGDLHCTGFVDADNDGICDLCANQQSHNGVCYSGSGVSHGYHAGHYSYNGTTSNATYRNHHSGYSSYSGRSHGRGHH